MVSDLSGVNITVYIQAYRPGGLATTYEDDASWPSKKKRSELFLEP